MKKAAVLFSTVGLLVGILLAGLFAAYAVNNNNRGMMGTMGMNSSRVMSGNIDRHFIEQMIPHHESAIEMAKLAKDKAKHEEIKTLSDNIISSQSAEINSMKNYYKGWFGTDVSTNTGGNMRGGSMMNSQASTDSLNAAEDFDEAFLAEMIDHHQMGVMMTRMLDTGTNRPEMKKLADDIITAQTREINDMQSWQQQWGYETSDNGAGGMMNMMGR